MSSKSHIILASGVNRAIEFAILYSLATAMPSSILLGCRETAKGEAAISDLRAQGIASTIIPIHLDVTSDDTVKAAIEAVVKKYGKLDVLIENAGSAVIPPGASDDPQGHRAAERLRRQRDERSAVYGALPAVASQVWRWAGHQWILWQGVIADSDFWGNAASGLDSV